MAQDKAQSAVNGPSLNKDRNAVGAICGPPFWRDEEPSSKALRLLERPCHYLRDAPCG